ncbi:MAG: hypothetical protein K8L97_28690 [Anaerolineae bacterium]|nr:hypothetical protein [Anaerolineae bacterium]
MAASSQNPNLFPLKWSILLWAGLLAFAALMVIALVPTVMERAAAIVHCPGAAEVIGRQQSSGSVAVQGGGTIRTSTTTITCVFADGRTSTIENDKMVITGFGLALVGGAGVGLLIALVRRRAK